MAEEDDIIQDFSTPPPSPSEIGDDECTFLEVPVSPWLGSKLEEEKSECQPSSDLSPGVAESDNLASILAGWLVV